MLGKREELCDGPKFIEIVSIETGTRIRLTCENNQVFQCQVALARENKGLMGQE